LDSSIRILPSIHILTVRFFRLKHPLGLRRKETALPDLLIKKEISFEKESSSEKNLPYLIIILHQRLINIFKGIVDLPRFLLQMTVRTNIARG
jgi:hypothetical protein